MPARLTDRGHVSSGRSTVRRIGLIGVGVILVLVGSVAWGWETEYGSGHGFSIEVVGDEAKVYDTDDRSGHNELVFEGTRAEADAYVDEQRTSGRNDAIPALILATGGALALVGVWPRRSRSE